MKTISISGHLFPRIGLGTYPMHGDVLRIALATAVSSGYRLIDTAFKYGNEQEIAYYLKSFPSSEGMIVQTKISVTQLLDKRFMGICFGRFSEEDALRGSLKRLGKKKLDVYLVHSPACGFESIYSSLMRFREEGLADIIGVCGFQEDHLRKIKNQFGEYPSINQIEVHPYNSNRRLVEFCKENGIIVEARSPFAHGDALNDFMMSPILSSMALGHHKTIPQIIIRWLIQQGFIVIAKSETPTHITENMDVFDFEITESEMEAIDQMNQNLSFGFVSKRQ